MVWRMLPILYTNLLPYCSENVKKKYKWNSYIDDIKLHVSVARFFMLYGYNAVNSNSLLSYTHFP